MKPDEILSVVPDEATFPDGEERYLVCLLKALEGARHYTALAAGARRAAGDGHEDFELVQDELLQLEHGLQRALQRRRRNLSAVIGSKRLAAVR